MTPAEAAAIVAAARAAAMQAEASQAGSGQPASPERAPPTSPKPPTPERAAQAFARTSAPALRSEPAEITAPLASRGTPAPSRATNAIPESALTEARAPAFLRTPPERSAPRTTHFEPAAAPAHLSAHSPTAAPAPTRDGSAATTSDRAGGPTPPPSARANPPSGAPTSSMWPLEGKVASAPSHSTAPPAQAYSSTAGAAAQQPHTVPAQPTFGHANVTVGTYADPTSILTRDTVHSAPMHVNWGDVTMDGLPKVARLQPIRPRRWPWVVFGLAAGAAAAVYFWLPHFDTQTLPPEMAAVVEPLKTAITSNSSATTNASAGDAQASTASDTSAAGSAALASGQQTSDLQTPGAQASGPQASRAQGAGAQAAGVRKSGAARAPGTAAGIASTAVSANAASPTSTQPAFTAGEEQRVRQMRQVFDNRLASLEARGAGVWGGHEFAMAKTRAAESVGAHDAGNPRMAQERLGVAMKLLDTVESKAPQALSAQVAAGEQALGAGQQEVAGQAFDLARRISPSDRRASDGQRRAQNLPAVLPLLADAQNAEVAHDYARAAQDYSQALSLDPGNATAKAGQARSNAAFGDDNYAKAVGSGFAALGAGRLDEAHEAFVKARALNPKGAEASEGLRRVGAALTARGFASMRQRAAGLEAQERWDEAERTYEDVLAADPSLAFAQEGKARTTSRADLSVRLQQLLDRPDRLSSPGVRDDARALMETARAQSPQGPVIRSQIARLEVLLPGFDKPVRLSLVSDNSTQVAISSIGAFGTFSRRDIELRPGKYTVVGTRNGFRDVRREITVAPGQDSQTIRVTCSEPI